MDDFLCSPSTANGYSIEGWLLPGGWRSGIYEDPDDMRI